MGDKIRWGILGTGAIAKKFAAGLHTLPDAELVAIGSRTQARADAFAVESNVPYRHASYESLVSDSKVDAVYVATPHSLHAENILLALEAGKPVLCEKPFTINAVQAEQVIHFAREKKILLMEAMWTRFLPLMVRLRELLAEGVIGEVEVLTADFGFKADRRGGRLFDPALGGGALLDLGVYPVSLAYMIFGPPVQVTGLVEIGTTGVDEKAAMIFKHAKGQLALLQTLITANTFHEASLVGTEGKITLHKSWWKGSDMTVALDNGGEELLEFPYTGNGYQFEAEAFMDCMRNGKTECAVMSLDETLAIMKTMDALRAQWGLKYPME
ncbi:Gfo/Idh/MocA family protein [Pedosphaera parvula]|uniref:Oxidoreductase domain protein n=1 Tax=Pedosphaera parvula (strain Ellin514) TaxID=320771 RepID=B9XBC2_PEDPL|nr:Gfo/Idh/MocA family oxidoreductase [Pedosphaera parvula]EEF62807.1 oxidoreductase domain protein [Pedosphaera parvula Ellin514]